jgi:hypothetical protein
MNWVNKRRAVVNNSSEAAIRRGGRADFCENGCTIKPLAE